VQCTGHGVPQPVAVLREAAAPLGIVVAHFGRFQYTAGMSPELINTIIDGGGLLGFAVFLVYQHGQMQKRLDTLLVDFQAELKRIDDGFDNRVGIIRERYEAVISSHRSEHRQERERMHLQISELQRDLLSRERESVMNLKADID